MSDRTRVLEAKDRRTLVLAGARLVVLRGPDKGRAVAIGAEETVIGTAETADLKLTDNTVSRNHLSVRAMSDTYIVSDLGSTNGTRIDGRRIISAYVSPRDKIELGDTVVRLEAQKEPVNLALSDAESFGRMLGRSVAARRLFATLEQIAPRDSTVLLSGETGTGKDLAAGAIHAASTRREGPFVVVDCSALVGQLMESELFGHERGAFTGAEGRRTGAWVEADRGTLFLDEIGELPLELQPKLLRALERGEVRPVGANAPIAVDVRIIAATNRDLKREVNRGSFREDLFYRLNVISIRVPPLRERVEDIELLAERFWREFTGQAAGQLPIELLNAFLVHPWPGNVRELRNRVENAAVMIGLEGGQGGGLTPAAEHGSYRAAKAAANAAFERGFVSELLSRAKGNVSEAARLAQMDRVYLSKLVRKYRTDAAP